MKKKSKSTHRLKQDGSTDTMCLSCFKTFTPTPVEASSPNAVQEHDHICAFAFPERRANEVTFEDGPKRRQSDMEWQALIARDVTVPGE